MVEEIGQVGGPDAKIQNHPQRGFFLIVQKFKKSNLKFHNHLGGVFAKNNNILILCICSF